MIGTGAGMMRNITVCRPSRDIERGLPPDTKLIFVVGAPRSGTTWLQLLVSASPSVATAVESHLFQSYLSSLFAGWRYYRDSLAPVGLHHLMEEDEYVALIRDLASKLMARILATKPGATIVLEKSPYHVFHWREILAVFPQAHFIHIIRDPRGAVASMRAAGHSFGAKWAPRRISQACSLWADCVRAGREIAGATPNYLEVRYKDLKNDGASTLHSVYEWCGLDISAAEAASILRDHQIDHLRSAAAPKLAATYAHQLPGFFRRGEVEGWRSDLTRREIRLVEHLTGEMMTDLGYLPSEHTRTRWRTVSIMPALGAEWFRSGMAWRLRCYADALRRV